MERLCLFSEHEFQGLFEIDLILPVYKGLRRVKAIRQKWEKTETINLPKPISVLIVSKYKCESNEEGICLDQGIPIFERLFYE